jgi:hypothetical protein
VDSFRIAEFIYQLGTDGEKLQGVGILLKLWPRKSGERKGAMYQAKARDLFGEEGGTGDGSNGL